MSTKGDLGVELAAYELMRAGWRVQYNKGYLVGNYERQGPDITAKRGKTTILVEVKFRDAFIKTNTGEVSVTLPEYKQMQYLALVLRDKDKNIEEEIRWEYRIYFAPKKKLTLRKYGKKHEYYRIGIPDIKRNATKQFT